MNILIIDDNPSDLEFYADLIDRIEGDYKVYTALDVEEGMALFKQHPIDCAFIDYYLPGADGISVMEMLQNTKGAEVMPLIILTGDPDQRIQAEAARKGALDYIVKGIDNCTPKQLEKVINKVVEWAEGLNKKDRIKESQRAPQDS